LLPFVAFECDKGFAAFFEYARTLGATREQQTGFRFRPENPAAILLPSRVRRFPAPKELRKNNALPLHKSRCAANKRDLSIAE